MAKGDDAIKEITELLEARVKSFTDGMPKAQQQAYKEVLNIASDLDKYSDGTIKPTVKNVRMIAKIKARLNEVLLDGTYYKKLDEVIKTYDQINKLQNIYFTSMVGQFGVPAVLGEIQKQSMDIVIESLGKDGLNTGVINKVRDILNRNITTGGKIGDFTEEVRIYLTDTKEGDGALKKYSGQIVTDALNQYSAQYNQLISDDLGFKFYQYAGTLVEHSREFCVKIIKAKESGCMRYIHVSQFDELLNGRICGNQIHINKKSNLPTGLIKGTNPSNILVNRGGWQCGHQFYGVPKAIVPKDLWAKFEN
jgi:hypothetical protein